MSTKRKNKKKNKFPKLTDDQKDLACRLIQASMEVKDMVQKGVKFGTGSYNKGNKLDIPNCSAGHIVARAGAGPFSCAEQLHLGVPFISVERNMYNEPLNMSRLEMITENDRYFCNSPGSSREKLEDAIDCYASELNHLLETK